MKLPDLKWNERYAWFWFNYDQMFVWKEEDFDKMAREYRDQEITTIILFSCTHYRYAFVPWWDAMLACMANIVKACHKYGIKVIDHASSGLRMYPLTEEDWKNASDEFSSKQGGSLSDFPEIVEYMGSDPIIDGERMSSWYQVCGVTGTMVRTGYSGSAFCFNNPSYKKSYYNLLRRIFETGVDGMMNDDMQYQNHSCACEHCRRLFREQYGYELPDTEHWGEFYNNYNDPVFVAFKKFREESAKRFYDGIIELEKECGVHMLRPNYISEINGDNWSAFPFESVAENFSNIFQENCSSSIIRYTFPQYMVESVHRCSLAKKYQVPSMSLFYPYREDDVYFSWALARVWGQLYTGIQVFDYNTTEMEKKYRIFEQEHAELYWNPRKVADVAIYMSLKTRDLVAHGMEPRPWMSWCQAACFSGLQAEMVFDFDGVDDLKKYGLVVVPGITMLSDEELKKLHECAQSGCKVAIVGKCGILDERGIARDFEVVRDMIGQENVVYIEQDTYNLPYHAHTLLRRWLPEENLSRTTYPKERNVLSQLRATMGETLHELLPKAPAVTISDDYLAGLFEVDGGYALNVLSIKDMLPQDTCEVGYTDVIPGFCEGDRIEEDLPITCTISGDIESVTLWSPSIDSGVSIPFSKEGETVTFTIPKGAFGGYALLELK